MYVESEKSYTKIDILQQNEKDIILLLEKEYKKNSCFFIPIYITYLLFVVVVSRRSEIAAGELSKLGSGVSSIPCDVTNQESVQSLVQKVILSTNFFFMKDCV